MILVCTGDPVVGELMKKCIKKGKRMVATSTDRAVELAGELHPSAIFVDARLGGSKVRALDCVSWIQKASPLSAVTILTYSPTEEEVNEINEKRCYSYVDLEAPTVEERVQRVIEASRERVGLQMVLMSTRKVRRRRGDGGDGA